MASSLTLKIAAVESIATFGKTDAEVAQILRWFIADYAGPEPEGMTQAQRNKWQLDQARDRIVGYVRQEAQRNRLHELRAQQASIEDQATTETAI